MNIGNNLKTLRVRKRLAQHECAKLAGVSQSTWCDWEIGKTKPRYARLPAIAEVFGVSVARLLA